MQTHYLYVYLFTAPNIHVCIGVGHGLIWTHPWKALGEINPEIEMPALSVLAFLTVPHSQIHYSS